MSLSTQYTANTYSLFVTGEWEMCFDSGMGVLC